MKNNTPQKPVFWLVKWGESLRVSDKTNSAAEACLQTFGMVGWNMAVKPLTSRKSDIQRAGWFQEQVKSPDGWALVPENELPDKLSVSTRQSHNPRIVNGVVRWKDDGKTPPYEEAVGEPTPSAAAIRAQCRMITVPLNYLFLYEGRVWRKTADRADGDIDAVEVWSMIRKRLSAANEPVRISGGDTAYPVRESTRSQIETALQQVEARAQKPAAVSSAPADEAGVETVDITPNFGNMLAVMLRDAGIFMDSAIGESRERGRVRYEELHAVLSRLNVAAQAVTNTDSFLAFRSALAAMTEKSSAHHNKAGVEYCPDHGEPPERYYDVNCHICEEVFEERKRASAAAAGKEGGSGA